MDTEIYSEMHLKWPCLNVLTLIWHLYPSIWTFSTCMDRTAWMHTAYGLFVVTVIFILTIVEHFLTCLRWWGMMALSTWHTRQRPFVPYFWSVKNQGLANACFPQDLSDLFNSSVPRDWHLGFHEFIWLWVGTQTQIYPLELIYTWLFAFSHAFTFVKKTKIFIQWPPT